MLKQEVKVKVEFTPGYETRFTEACLRQLESRERNRMGLNPPPVLVLERRNQKNDGRNYYGY